MKHFETDPLKNSQSSITWFKRLSPNQRINLKDCSNLLIGISWSNLTTLFTFKEKVKILHEKLKIEGFDV